MLQISDKEFVAPPHICRNVDGVRLDISPIVTEEVFDLLELVEPFYDDLSVMDLAALDAPEPDKADADAYGTWKARKALLREDLIRLVVKTRGRLLDAVALCSRCHWVPGEPEARVSGAAHRAWLGSLLLDRTLDITLDCIEVNRDFFLQAMPQMEAAVRRIAKPAGAAPAQPPAASAGATPSSP